MELREFIAATIKDIVGGVADAKSQLPRTSTGDEIKGGREKYEIYSDRIEVEFDIEVGMSSADESKGGLTVLLASIGVGAGTKSSAEEKTTNRINFRVPVQLPVVCGDSIVKGAPRFDY